MNVETCNFVLYLSTKERKIFYHGQKSQREQLKLRFWFIAQLYLDYLFLCARHTYHVIGGQIPKIAKLIIRGKYRIYIPHMWEIFLWSCKLSQSIEIIKTCCENRVYNLTIYITTQWQARGS